MKEVWDYENLELVDEDGRITDIGLDTYWLSVDAAVKFNAKKREMDLAKSPILIARQSKARSNPNNLEEANSKMKKFFTKKAGKNKGKGRRLPRPKPKPYSYDC